MNQSLYNLTQHYLKIIYKLNPELNAFITVTAVAVPLEEPPGE